jgi:hypothetical protein
MHLNDEVRGMGSIRQLMTREVAMKPSPNVPFPLYRNGLPTMVFSVGGNARLQR